MDSDYRPRSTLRLVFQSREIARGCRRTRLTTLDSGERGFGRGRCPCRPPPSTICRDELARWRSSRRPVCRARCRSGAARFASLQESRGKIGTALHATIRAEMYVVYQGKWLIIVYVCVYIYIYIYINILHTHTHLIHIHRCSYYIYTCR